MKGRIFFSTGLALVLVQFVLAYLSGSSAQAGGCNRYVLGFGGADVGDCSDENHPCKTVQYAIDKAAKGEVVCVAKHNVSGPLVYAENLHIKESIALDGAWNGFCSMITPTCTFTPIHCDPGNVTIDAGGNGRAIEIKGTIAPTISCFTITGGDAVGLGGDPGSTIENDAGGGIYSQDAAPIIINNVITGNYGCRMCTAGYGRGGGIYLLNAPEAALIQDNLIANNVADDSTWGEGGGIMLRFSDAQVLSNTIRNNRAGHSAGDGGGIAIKDGMPIIAGNTITSNRAGQSVAGWGGGIYVWSSTPATIERNRIGYNMAISGVGGTPLISSGGGIYYSGNPTASVTLRDNVIYSNIASVESLSGQGGGVYLEGLLPSSIVSGNTLDGNIAGHDVDGRGGGMYVDSSELTITDNLFTENSATWSGGQGEGGGLYIHEGSVIVQSNVISSNYGAGFPGSPSTAIGYGGGIAVSGGQPVLQDNTILRNRATNGEHWGMGGGIFTNLGDVQILGNTIAENYATSYQSGFGGGVAISGSLSLLNNNRIFDNIATASSPTGSSSGKSGAGGGLYTLSASGVLVGNSILHNLAAETDYGYGGGAYLESSNLWLDGNTILDNYASLGSTSQGGGLRFVLGSVFTMTNNIIARNRASSQASGVSALASSSGTLIHNTIAENVTHGGDGTGVFVNSNSHVNLYNNIIVEQFTGIQNAEPLVSTVNASYTLFDDNILDYSTGVVSGFEIPGPAALLSDYRLSGDSNAIDQGIPFAWITWDIDLNSRPVGPAPDVGADEYPLSVFLPLLLVMSLP